MQEPNVLGAKHLRVFGDAPVEEPTPYPVLGSFDGPKVLAGLLHGYAPGDLVDVVVAEEVRATATLVDVGPDRSRLQLDSDLDEVPANAFARLRSRARRLPVQVAGAGALAERLTTALRASQWVYPAAGAEPATLAVELRDGALVVDGPGLARKPQPWLAGPRQIESIVADLEALARARRVAEVCQLAARPAHDMEFWVDVHADGQTRRLAARGETLFVRRDRVSLGMRRYNAGSNRASVYVHILERRVSGRVAPLQSNVVPQYGYRLYGTAPDNSIEFIHSTRLSWPSDVPAQPLPAGFWFVVTNRPVDLSALVEPPKTEAMARARAPGPPVSRSELRAAITAAETEHPLHTVRLHEYLLRPLAWFVARVEFTLSPASAPD